MQYLASLLRQNDVETLFCQNNDVIIASCVRWAVFALSRVAILGALVVFVLLFKYMTILYVGEDRGTGARGLGAGKSEFWAGVPEKKNREKWGGGRDEKKWAGVGGWTRG